MLLLDNIIFELQRAGGVSLVWRAIVDACLTDRELPVEFLDSGLGQTNIFYPPQLPTSKIITERGALLIRRYQNISAKLPAKVFHSSYFRVHNNKQVKNIVTVHDFVYEKFDSGLRKQVHLWQKKHALNRADVIICVSEHTKTDLLHYHPQLASKDIRVIHNGVGLDFCPPLAHNCTALSAQHSPPYLLYVGGRFAHKNFIAALQLLNSPISKKLGLQLKVVGGGAFSSQEQQLITELQLSARVVHTGQVNNQTLNKLYNDAFALIYPSLYEGFGIPPLEAMAAGCPVICSKISSIPEVVANAGLLFEPTDIGSASRYIDKLQQLDYRAQVIKKGLLRAAQFSWAKTGQQTTALYRELL